MPLKQVLKDNSRKQKYNMAAGDAKFTPDFVIKNTFIPERVNDIPNVLGWSGPARSGTTALLFLMANCSLVDRVYFQPQKTLLRKGAPAFTLKSGDSLICMKEVFGRNTPYMIYDPIDLLLKSGIPPEKIVWISILRDPIQTFASWYNLVPSSTEEFATVQHYVVEHFNYYRSLGVKIVPFVYDLLGGAEPQVVQSLLERVGLGGEVVDLTFNAHVIDQKLVGGQAVDREYFKINIAPTLAKNKFIYSRNNYGLDDRLADEIRKMCQEEYETFARMARAELALPPQS